jgi:hypothetical protein
MTDRKFHRAASLLILTLAGCARTPDHSEYLDPPSDEARLQQTLKASEKGPSSWSPAVTIPLYPVLLVVDTSIKFVDATYRYLRDLFGGTEETPPVPERVERQAEKIPKN